MLLQLYLFGGGKKVPSLLRDLLASTELLTLLGPSHVNWPHYRYFFLLRVHSARRLAMFPV